jgi:nucleotide-binding universal stress UspA family protein
VLITSSWEAASVERLEKYLDVRVGFLERDALPLLVLARAAPDAIVSAGNEPGAPVCMTTHGRGGLLRAALGSVAEAVVHGSSRPVVLVGPRCRSDWELPDVSELVAGFDGSDPSHAGVRAAGDPCNVAPGRVRVVEMSRRPEVLGASRFPTGHVDALEEAVAELRATGIDSSYDVVDGLDEAAALIDAANQTDAALLALGTHGRQGISRLALGSVTTRVVHYTPVPVMVVRPEASRHPAA